MSNKKILSMLTALGIVTSTLSANEGVIASVYGGGIQYKNSAKDRAYIGGVFLSQSFIPIGESFKFSIDAERTIIKYKKNLSIPDYGQNDLTGEFNFYYGYNWNFSLGGHKVFVDNNKNDNPWASFVGIEYYKYGIYNTGINFFYSNYNTSDIKLKAYQISPYFGAYFGNPYSYIAQYIGTYYVKLKADYQIFNNKDPFSKKRYISGELKIVNYHKNWSFEVNGEFGTSAYKILNKGFVMRNQSEQTVYSAGMKLNVTLTPLISLSTSYSRLKIKYTDKTGYDNLALAFVNISF